MNRRNKVHGTLVGDFRFSSSVTVCTQNTFLGIVSWKLCQNLPDDVGQHKQM